MDGKGLRNPSSALKDPQSVKLLNYIFKDRKTVCACQHWPAETKPD